MISRIATLRPLARFNKFFPVRRTYLSTLPHSSRHWCRSNVLLFASGFAVSATVAALSSKIYLDSDAVTQDTILDPDTSIAFPTTLKIQSKVPLPNFTLIGVGVRTVSFLGIQVYSVGLYADLDSPALNISQFATPEEKTEHIVRNSACVLRIIPTRNTSYTHLRDGFMRSLQSRLVWCKQRNLLPPEEERAVQSPLTKFKSMWPTTSLLKYQPLDILITAPSAQEQRSVIVRDLGAVQSDWIARELVLAYFEGKGISPKLKQSVFQRLGELGG